MGHFSNYVNTATQQQHQPNQQQRPSSQLSFKNPSVDPISQYSGIITTSHRGSISSVDIPLAADSIHQLIPENIDEKSEFNPRSNAVLNSNSNHNSRPSSSLSIFAPKSHNTESLNSHSKQNIGRSASSLSTYNNSQMTFHNSFGYKTNSSSRNGTIRSMKSINLDNEQIPFHTNHATKKTHRASIYDTFETIRLPSQIDDSKLDDNNNSNKQYAYQSSIKRSQSSLSNYSSPALNTVKVSNNEKVIKSGYVSLFIPSQNWTQHFAVLTTAELKFFKNENEYLTSIGLSSNPTKSFKSAPSTIDDIKTLSPVKKLVSSFENIYSSIEDQSYNLNSTALGKPVVKYPLSYFSTIRLPSSFKNLSEIKLCGKTDVRFAVSTDPERNRWVSALQSINDFLIADSIESLIKRSEDSTAQLDTAVAAENEIMISKPDKAVESSDKIELNNQLVENILTKVVENSIKNLSSKMLEEYSKYMTKEDFSKSLQSLKLDISKETETNLSRVTDFSKQFDHYQSKMVLALREAAEAEKFNSEELKIFMKDYMKELAVIIRSAVDRDDLVSDLKHTINESLSVGNYNEFIESLQIGKNIQSDLINMLRGVNDTMESFKTHFPLLSSKSETRTIIDGIEEIKIRMGRPNSLLPIQSSTASLFSTSSTNVTVRRTEDPQINDKVVKKIDGYFDAQSKSLIKLQEQRAEMFEYISSLKNSIDNVERQSRDRQNLIIDRLNELSTTSREQTIKITNIKNELAITKEIITDDTTKDRMDDLMTLLSVMVNKDTLGSITSRLDGLETMVRNLKQSERLAQLVNDLESRRNSLKKEIDSMESIVANK